MWQTRHFARQLDRRTSRVASSRDLVRAFPIQENVSLYGAGWYDGCTAPLERYILGHLIRYFQPRAAIEVGTFRGCTTRIMAENLPALSTLFTIDLPMEAGRDFEALRAATDRRLIDQRAVGFDYADSPRAGDIRQIFGDTFDPATWETIPPGAEFAFIDASHSYEAVKNDTEKVRAKLTPGGVIVWHDYSEGETAERGVGRYIREQMAVQDDIFLCEATTLAIRVPDHVIRQGRARIADFFTTTASGGDVVSGVFPWLS
jgi:predicted O-methyltransferase YrrM